MVLLTLSGCANVSKSVLASGQVIQDVLNAVLPPDFVGDIPILRETVKGYNVEITIRAGNVRKLNGRWGWTWLTWTRNGFLTSSVAVFGSPPGSLIP